MSKIVCRLLGLVDNPEGHKDIDRWMDGWMEWAQWDFHPRQCARQPCPRGDQTIRPGTGTYPIHIKISYKSTSPKLVYSYHSRIMSYSLMIFIRINSRVLIVYISSSISDEARLDLISLSLGLYQVNYYYFQEDSQIRSLVICLSQQYLLFSVHHHLYGIHKEPDHVHHTTTQDYQ